MSLVTEYAAQGNGLDMKTLFIRSVPPNKTDGELSEFFSHFAPIKHAVLVKDKDQKSRGFGFVSFAVEEDALEALKQAKKTKFDGHQLRVDIAKRRRRGDKNAGNREQENQLEDYEVNPEDDNDGNSLLKGKPKLIIRNMPWSFRDPEKLKNIFKKYGLVVEATIPRKPTGQLCGFAFVTMKKISNCKKAIEDTKDLKIDGRRVAVDFAVQKNVWEDFKHKHGEAEGEDQSENASEEDGSNIDGKMDVQKFDPPSDEELSEEEDEERKRKTTLKTDLRKREEFSVFVRNVPYDATQDSLIEHFQRFGPVKYALPVIDKNTGLAKGTAFISFCNKSSYDKCLENAPTTGATSLLIGGDVLPEYVYEGRVLSISPTLKRDQADIMTEKNANKRKLALGKAPSERDKRNLYLLNEGKIPEGSKLATLLSEKDMEIRNASYNLRVEQLKKNPSLHLSLTRLAIRNLPRSMNDKALKALARKAVVQFAAEVKSSMRHPLSKEEIIRSTREKDRHIGSTELEQQQKKDKKRGVVKQAKVINEVKGSSKGRSRGYGFIEFKDHKHALMGLRWLNVHQVTKDEICEGLNEQEIKLADLDKKPTRRLCVEFAIENSNVVKRRRERVNQAREISKKKYQVETTSDDNTSLSKDEVATDKRRRERVNQAREISKKKYQVETTSDDNTSLSKDEVATDKRRKRDDSGLSDETKRLIGIKRRKRRNKK